MAIEIISDQNEGHRINHPVYMDVYNVTYAKATITDFEMVEDTWDLTDRCKIDLSGYDDEWLPIFYHCKLHCYNEDMVTLRSNNAIYGGAMAFQVGDEVKVLLEENKPKYIIGHYDNKPRMCADIFKMTIECWYTGFNFLYYQGRVQEEYGELNIEPIDYYGNTPICDQEGYILFGQTPFFCIVTQHYWGDFYVKVGPVFYIIRIKSTGLPGPATGNITTFKAIWSEELEQECIRLGQAAEKTITLPIACWPIFPVYPDAVKSISKFPLTFNKRFLGFQPPQPKWWLTKLYGQSYYEK